jgi:hypothetical protein
LVTFCADGALVLPLVLQIGGVQIEPITPRLLRVRPGSTEPRVLDAIRRAERNLDGTRRCYWVDAFKLRQLASELRANGDLFRLSTAVGSGTA